ncbi:hypothetical protein GCM10025859_47140 [Alicyclobacillus fastidiosus]|nr:hypothetical protein GCM10025859_47140 [Alicyclobacillus fastidiosus]
MYELFNEFQVPCHITQFDVMPWEILFVDDKERNTRVADEVGQTTHIYTTVDYLLVDLARLRPFSSLLLSS